MNLSQLRSKIDELDAKIIQFLNERTQLALEVGKVKSEEGKEIYAPERESQIYQKIDREAKGPLPKDSLKSIYREIMSAALAIEKPLTIAYLGPEATFTHIASLSKFGSSVNYFPAQSISRIFSEVEKRQADYGVIPIENSIEGVVTHSVDMFLESDLKICSEVLLNISHNLMSNSTLKNIKRIYSVGQAIAQSRNWIEAHLPNVEIVETASTAAGVKHAQTEDGSAAIGTKLASTLYNVPIVADNIQDSAQNMTRFLVISRQIPKPTGHDKTSLLISIKDKPGALYEMLAPIRKYKINMTKIESRPSKKKAWDYYFFIDFEGHVENPAVKKMLREMEGKVKFVKVLGSYPASAARET